MGYEEQYELSFYTKISKNLKHHIRLLRLLLCFDVCCNTKWEQLLVQSYDLQQSEALLSLWHLLINLIDYMSAYVSLPVSLSFFFLPHLSFYTSPIYFHFILAVTANLGVTSKPNRRLTGGSVRFRAFAIVCNYRNRSGPDGTTCQLAVGFWSHPVPFFFFFKLPTISAWTHST